MHAYTHNHVHTVYFADRPNAYFRCKGKFTSFSVWESKLHILSNITRADFMTYQTREIAHVQNFKSRDPGNIPGRIFGFSLVYLKITL